MTGLEKINLASAADACQLFFKCCSSRKWSEQMTLQRPYQDATELLKVAEEVYQLMDHNDWLEAFSGHPKIGDLQSLRQKFSATEHWSAEEQKGVVEANESQLKALHDLNKAYEDKFHFIFIVCATGRSVQEMLDLLKARYQNTIEEELDQAILEQKKITALRLRKL